MFIAEKKIEMKDGRICTLRSPRPDDALNAIEYMKVTAGETDLNAKQTPLLHGNYFDGKGLGTGNRYGNV